VLSFAAVDCCIYISKEAMYSVGKLDGLASWHSWQSTNCILAPRNRVIWYDAPKKKNPLPMLTRFNVST